MLNSRLAHAHAALVDVLRDADLEDPAERRIFEDCLAAARLVGRNLDASEGAYEDGHEHEEHGMQLLQVA